MNQETALRKGYVTTGIYDRNADSVRVRCEAIRNLGYKALVVTVPDSKYSRGNIGVGYAVVVEARYMRDQNADRLRSIVQSHAARVDSLLEDMEEKLAREIAEMEKNKATSEAWLLENGYSL